MCICFIKNNHPFLSQLQLVIFTSAAKLFLDYERQGQSIYTFATMAHSVQ